MRRQQAKGFHTFVWKEAWASLVMEIWQRFSGLRLFRPQKTFYYTAQQIPVEWSDVRWGSHFKRPLNFTVWKKQAEKVSELPIVLRVEDRI